MSPAAKKAPDIGPAIERFLAIARQPVLLEPGADPIPLAADNFVVSGPAARPMIECWSTTKNLVRRIKGIRAERRGKLELETEHFGGRTGFLLLIDTAQPSNSTASLRGDRLKYREQFRLALRRQYPDWRIAELSTEQDLEHTLSPTYPRALLRKGSTAMAAIGAAEDAHDPDGALSFGLIWLDYLRRREKRFTVGGLILFLPIGAEINTCHRARFLDPRTAQTAIFVHGPGIEEAVYPADYTNFSTRLDPFRAPQYLGTQTEEWVARLTRMEGVQLIHKPAGNVSLAVRGVEFARTSGAELIFGLDRDRHAAGATQISEIQALAQGLARLRHPETPDRHNPLYLRQPEAWLESQVRGHLQLLDATLLPSPLYTQAPQIASGERGILDLLAVDDQGRLAVLEIKASEDIHLPLQALDYWMRVHWHLQRGDFERAGYFPGIPLQNTPPRLILVAPALQFHPSNETILRFIAPTIQIERLGVGLEWRRELRIALRA
ncbi:MAG: hypothetical protein ABI995_07840 [Acidobacteriota bacterium]